MIKKGFTLQEALIALTVIGVVAAVTVPRLAKLAPDQNQTKYLKAHAMLTDITNQMLVDPALYFCNDVNIEGLNCTNMPKEGSIPDDLYQTLSSLRDNNNNIGSALDKYANIFAYNMHISRVENINNLNNNNDPNNINHAIAFRAKDGVVWIFGRDENNANNPILVDIDMDGISPNPDNDNQFSYDNEQNTTPDRFSFDIAVDGTITPTDPMGQFYLENSTDTHTKSSKKVIILETNQDPNNNGRYRPKLGVSKACDDSTGTGICGGQM